MNHTTVSEMLGVYALHACVTGERLDIEQHVALCPACSAELATLTAVVWRLDEAMLIDPLQGGKP